MHAPLPDCLPGADLPKYAFAKGEKVEIWSHSKLEWIAGEISEVFLNETMDGKMQIEAGTLKVSYSGAQKYIPLKAYLDVRKTSPEVGWADEKFTEAGKHDIVPASDGGRIAGVAGIAHQAEWSVNREGEWKRFNEEDNSLLEARYHQDGPHAEFVSTDISLPFVDKKKSGYAISFQKWTLANMAIPMSWKIRREVPGSKAAETSEARGRSASGDSKVTGQKVAEAFKFKLREVVEVYSQSQQQWLNGEVIEIYPNGMVRVLYGAHEKVIPQLNSDLIRKETTLQTTFMKALSSAADNGSLQKCLGAGVQVRGSKTSDGAEEQGRKVSEVSKVFGTRASEESQVSGKKTIEALKFKLDEAVKVYSRSQQQWLDGVVLKILPDCMVCVRCGTNQKVISQLDSNLIRKASEDSKLPCRKASEGSTVSGKLDPGVVPQSRRAPEDSDVVPQVDDATMNRLIDEKLRQGQSPGEIMECVKARVRARSAPRGGVTGLASPGWHQLEDQRQGPEARARRGPTTRAGSAGATTRAVSAQGRTPPVQARLRGGSPGPPQTRPHQVGSGAAPTLASPAAPREGAARRRVR